MLTKYHLDLSHKERRIEQYKSRFIWSWVDLSYFFHINLHGQLKVNCSLGQFSIIYLNKKEIVAIAILEKKIS